MGESAGQAKALLERFTATPSELQNASGQHYAILIGMAGSETEANFTCPIATDVR